MQNARAEKGLALKAKLLAGACVLFAASFFSGCASGLFCQIPMDQQAECAGDRCYIEDFQFLQADQLYNRLGSISLVERHLREIEQWRECEINEALYRLRKVHRLP